MLTTKATIEWADIVVSEIVTQCESGIEYLVPSVGRVWMSRHDLRENLTASANMKCNLVADADTPEPERLWAVLDFIKP